MMSHEHRLVCEVEELQSQVQRLTEQLANLQAEYEYFLDNRERKEKKFAQQTTELIEVKRALNRVLGFTNQYLI